MWANFRRKLQRDNFTQRVPFILSLYISISFFFFSLLSLDDADIILVYNSVNSDKRFDPNRNEIDTIKLLMKQKKNIHAA